MDRVVSALGDQLNPWGYVLVFVVTLLEAAAFIGLFVPGETALLLAGFIASQGRLSLWVLMVVAAIGAVLGDSTGYEIGRHFGERMRTSRLGRKVGKKRWDRAHDYIRDRGGRAILLGRFIGVLRALVPAVAGDSRMPYRTFLLWNVVGALITAPALVLAGYLAGDSYKVVDRYLGRGSLVLLALVVVGVGAVHLVRKRRKGSSSKR